MHKYIIACSLAVAACVDGMEGPESDMDALDAEDSQLDVSDYDRDPDLAITDADEPSRVETAPIREVADVELPSEGAPSAIAYVVSNPCGSWNNPGAGSICGTDFFGETSIKMKNCGDQYQYVIYEGYFVAVPPKRNVTLFGSTVTVCGVADKSARYWGARVTFANTGTAPVYFGH